ncbi:hypothetical protein GCM10010201_15910 [Pilimelia columellifera subsp. columellifera]|uniref:Uncharacterized protein n=1 Tax=Pilimelia columellifera subsp. columellifera TaxID=706583 RepID=A0ABP6ANM7_9ACTN
MRVDPATGSVDPGQPLRVEVATAVVSGGPQQVTMSASGLPAGATAEFHPETVTAGESAKLVPSAGAGALTWAPVADHVPDPRNVAEYCGKAPQRGPDALTCVRPSSHPRAYSPP